jgi:sialidase-1
LSRVVLLFLLTLGASFLGAPVAFELAASQIAASQIAPPQITLPTSADIFVAGQDGYHTFRIPSLIVTPKGTLLAFAEGRRTGGADAGDIDLVLKRSRDDGASWSAMQVVADDGANTVGNPCPVIDRKTGVIWLLTTHNLGTDREKDIIAGTSASSRTVWVMTSRNDGVTWSKPREITREVKQPDWTWYATGPGVGIQLRSGRLLIPANHVDASTGVHRSHLVYSDDHGRHWKIGASADAGTNESQVVELADGRLMLNMRNHPPKPENFRLVATSTDGGITLSPAVPDRALIEPPAQASILSPSPASDRSRRVTARDHWLLFANPASTKRERMTVRVSYDEGHTWPAARVIHEGPAAYSSLAALPGQTIGLLYERGEKSAYEKITFTRLPLDWLTSDQAR